MKNYQSHRKQGQGPPCLDLVERRGLKGTLIMALTASRVPPWGRAGRRGAGQHGRGGSDGKPSSTLLEKTGHRTGTPESLQGSA